MARLGKDARGNKTDFTSIQAAIDAAPNESLIEIVDNGPYLEELFLRADTTGLNIRGKRGSWPVITHKGPLNTLFAIHGRRTRLSRLVFVHANPTGEHPRVIDIQSECGVDKVLVVAGSRVQGIEFGGGGPKELSESVILGYVGAHNTRFRNCLIQMHARLLEGPSDMRWCVANEVQLDGRESHSVADSIVGKSTNPAGKLQQVNNCATFLADPIRDSRNCFLANPQFLDPANLDYRLAEKSPCRGKASDGGDLGVRWTPEMLEMVKIANDLRAKGIIKF